MSFHESWTYPHNDPSVHLFDDAVKTWKLDMPQGGNVLELGCCETDFNRWLANADPDVRLVGVDVNPYEGYRGTFYQQPAETLEFAPNSFDAVVALGSIEHFGLGFYGDPLNETADAETVALVERWLRPGGWFFYDVPWTPETGYVTENRHFRVYDDAMLYDRLTGGLLPVGRLYAHGETAISQYARPAAPMVPFWYCMRVLRKARVH